MKYDEKNRREYKVIGTTSRPGKSTYTIICPFCDERFIAYIWSLAGGGKKCPGCGAMHTGWGNAYPEIKK